MAKLWPGHDFGIHKHTHTDRVNSICPSAISWRGHKKILAGGRGGDAGVARVSDFFYQKNPSLKKKKVFVFSF